MEEEPDCRTGPSRHERLIESLDRMVESGRVTEAEAAQLRATAGPAEFENALQKIRVRHAGARLSAAVEAGEMTQDEADGYLQRLERGEHPKGLRAHLGRLLPRAR